MNCYAQAATLQAVVPVTDVVETVRHLLPEGGSETVSRNDYKLVQTPQVFTVELLKTVGLPNTMYSSLALYFPVIYFNP